LSLRFIPNPAVTTAELESSLVVLDLSSNAYFKLNGVGAEIWRQLENGGDEQAIVDGISAQFQVDRETAAADVRGFLQELESAGLITGERDETTV
jgi:hypothetical protein